MVGVICAVILGLVALVAVVVGRRFDSGNANARTGAYVAGTVLIVISLGIVVSGSLYKQDVGEAMVLRSPGGVVVGVHTTAGFSVKPPWNSAVKFDVRNQTITMADDGSGKGVDGPALNTQTSDSATATIDLTVRYSIIPSAVGKIYAEYLNQTNLVERALKNDIRSVVRNVPVTYSAATLRQQREKVTDDIAKALQARWDDLGVIVDSVDLRDIRYNDAIEASLAGIQTSAAKVAEAEQQLQAARIDAEKVKTEAQAQSDADQIIRCGATSKLVDSADISGRKIQVTVVTPIPIDQCQNRLNEQVLTSKYIDMLRLAAQGGSSVFVVPPGSNNLLNLQAPTTVGGPSVVCSGGGLCRRVVGTTPVYPQVIRALAFHKSSTATSPLISSRSRRAAVPQEQVEIR